MHCQEGTGLGRRGLSGFKIKASYTLPSHHLQALVGLNTATCVTCRLWHLALRDITHKATIDNISRTLTRLAH